MVGFLLIFPPIFHTIYPKDEKTNCDLYHMPAVAIEHHACCPWGGFGSPVL